MKDMFHRRPAIQHGVWRRHWFESRTTACSYSVALVECPLAELSQANVAQPVSGCIFTAQVLRGTNGGNFNGRRQNW